MIRTGVDVTEHEQAKQQVRERDATMRALMETAAQAILAVAQDGRIALVNAAAEKMFGYERQELIGRPVETLIPKRLAEQHVSHRAGFYQHPADRPMGVGLDLAGLRNGGVEFPVEVSLSHAIMDGGILAVAVVSDLTKRKRSEDDLRESEARLHTLSAGLLAAREEERKRISRELHDDFTQRLAMLSVDLAQLEDALPDVVRPIRNRLLALEASLAGISDDLKRVAYRLHPSILEHLGLPAALESFCEDVSRQGQIKVRVRQRGVPEHLPDGVALCLYRVAQECLRNVASHSGASRASVVLVGNRTEIWLAITDRGKGFDPGQARKRGGLGLVSMEERVRILNGTVSIVSRPGGGTRVLVRIPLRMDAL